MFRAARRSRGRYLHAMQQRVIRQAPAEETPDILKEIGESEKLQAKLDEELVPFTEPRDRLTKPA